MASIPTPATPGTPAAPATPSSAARASAVHTAKSNPSFDGRGGGNAPENTGGSAGVRALWAALALLGLGALANVPTVLYHLSEKLPIPWSRLGSESLAWMLWLALLPLVVHAARRFPVTRRNWRQRIVIHLAIGTAVSCAYALLILAKNVAILALGTGMFTPRPFSLLPSLLFGGLQIYLLLYGASVAAVHALDSHRRLVDRERSTAQLEADLSKAQLQVLKMQLEPHFLFNALNAISAQVHRDPDAAERMIALLSDFLRMSLTRAARDEVTLAEELSFLGRYLDIQKVRFGDRLTVENDVDPNVLDAPVPSLILQPIVENSIRHGVGSRSAPLALTIRAHRLSNGRLEIVIEDDGPGLPLGEIQEGVGLSNTRGRLAHLFGNDHAFEIMNRAPSGVRVRIEIPRARVDARGLAARERLAAAGGDAS